MPYLMVFFVGFIGGFITYDKVVTPPPIHVEIRLEVPSQEQPDQDQEHQDEEELEYTTV